MKTIYSVYFWILICSLKTNKQKNNISPPVCVENHPWCRTIQQSRTLRDSLVMLVRDLGKVCYIHTAEVIQHLYPSFEKGKRNVLEKYVRKLKTSMLVSARENQTGAISAQDPSAEFQQRNFCILGVVQMKIKSQNRCIHGELPTVVINRKKPGGKTGCYIPSPDTRQISSCKISLPFSEEKILLKSFRFHLGLFWIFPILLAFPLWQYELLLSKQTVCMLMRKDISQV